MSERIADYSKEPNWFEIGWKYEELAKATEELGLDIGRYKEALKDLDAAGTSIQNGKERIFLLKEAIAQIEAKS